MFRNVYYDRFNNKIHLWEIDKDENRIYKTIDWVPYVFIKTNVDTRN